MNFADSYANVITKRLKANGETEKDLVWTEFRSNALLVLFDFEYAKFTRTSQTVGKFSEQ